MSHSVETSEKYYRQHHRRNVAVATHTAIHQTMSEYLKFTLYWFSISCISGRSTAVTEPERGFSEGAVGKMRQFFTQAIARGARPTSSLCRLFLAQESISNKSPKQVQDKVYTLRDKWTSSSCTTHRHAAFRIVIISVVVIVVDPFVLNCVVHRIIVNSFTQCHGY